MKNVREKTIDRLNNVMKRIDAFILVMALILSVMPVLKPAMVVRAETATSGYCGAPGNEQNVTWEYDEETTTLTISGTGDMVGHTGDSWAWFKNDITTLVINDGITGIGEGAFQGCSSLSTLTGAGVEMEKTEYAVHAAGSVVRCGKYAFKDTIWENDETVAKHSGGNYYVGRVMYKGGPGRRVYVAQGTVAIADYACFFNRSIEELNLPITIERIGDCAFEKCIKLKK